MGFHLKAIDLDQSVQLAEIAEVQEAIRALFAALSRLCHWLCNTGRSPPRRICSTWRFLLEIDTEEYLSETAKVAVLGQK